MQDSTGLERVTVDEAEAGRLTAAAQPSGSHKKQHRGGACAGYCSVAGKCVLSKPQAHCCKSHRLQSLEEYAQLQDAELLGSSGARAAWKCWRKHAKGDE